MVLPSAMVVDDILCFILRIMKHKIGTIFHDFFAKPRGSHVVTLPNPSYTFPLLRAKFELLDDAPGGGKKVLGGQQHPNVSFALCIACASGGTQIDYNFLAIQLICAIFHDLMPYNVIKHVPYVCHLRAPILFISLSSSISWAVEYVLCHIILKDHRRENPGSFRNPPCPRLLPGPNHHHHHLAREKRIC